MQRLHYDGRMRPFGRKSVASAIATELGSTLADDLRMFALTFAGGFLFMSVYLA